MSDDRPPEKPTVELERPPAWAISMMERQQEGFTAIENRLDTMETNLDLQGDTTRDVAKRMTGVEERLTKVEERQTSASMRAKQPSDVDIQIKDELTAKVDALTKKTDEQTEAFTKKTDEQTEAFKARVDALTAAQTTAIFTKIEQAVKTPLGQQLLALLTLLISTAIAGITGWLARGGHQ